jgi:hypothetical protein
MRRVGCEPDGRGGTIVLIGSRDAEIGAAQGAAIQPVCDVVAAG